MVYSSFYIREWHIPGYTSVIHVDPPNSDTQAAKRQVICSSPTAQDNTQWFIWSRIAVSSPIQTGERQGKHSSCWSAVILKSRWTELGPHWPAWEGSQPTVLWPAASPLRFFFLLPSFVISEAGIADDILLGGCPVFLASFLSIKI